MKKFAYIMMGEDLNPSEHKAEFKTDSAINYIYTVRNKEEAINLIKDLKSQNVGVVEVCGAFGRDLALEIIEESNNEIGIGYVVNEPEQNDLFDKFFG